MPLLEKKEEISRQYEELRQVSNCVGAIDGKQVQIIAPSRSRSDFYNYKGNFSIVLQAVVDARYSFIATAMNLYRWMSAHKDPKATEA